MIEEQELVFDDRLTSNCGGFLSAFKALSRRERLKAKMSILWDKVVAFIAILQLSFLQPGFFHRSLIM